MTTIINTVSVPVSFETLYQRMLPQFQFFTKHLMRRRGGRRLEFDDVIQELAGFALENYTSLVRRSKETYYTPIAKYAIKRYREGRRFAGTNTTDILSEQAQALGRCDTCQLSQFDDEQNFMQDQHASVADAVQMSIDYADWVAKQPARDQAIIRDLPYGYTTGDVASKYGVSAARISQYRKRYANSWDDFIEGEPA